MTFSQLTVQFPHLAAELGQLSGPELDEAVRRVVEEGLSATGLQLTSRSPKDLERLVWSLDDEAWGLQEKAEAGHLSPSTIWPSGKPGPSVGFSRWSKVVTVPPFTSPSKPSMPMKTRWYS